MPSDKGRLPDFIVIGAQKAGTSTLYATLSAHPRVAMALRSEVEYFGDPRKLARGPDYYRRFFPEAPDGVLVGEVSPGYLFKPGAPEEISALLPDVRLIASLRDPVDRAFSAWKMQISKGSDLRPFGKAVREEGHYIDIGRYGEQLSRYLGYFPRDRMRLLFFEELQEDPDAFFGKVAEFLGIQPAGGQVMAENPGGMPRSRMVTRALNAGFRMREFLRRTPFRPLVDNLFVDQMSRRLRNRIAAANRDPGLTAAAPNPDDVAYIRDRLQGDRELLREILGEEAPAWVR
jgi:hypothetical protein